MRTSPPRGPGGDGPAFVADGDASRGFYARDVGPDLLRRLRGGELEIEEDLDLHGLREDEARRAVAQAVADAATRGVRALRIVHGKGLHSPGEPVLRDAVRGWLGRPPLSARLAAFAPAPPREGGDGATLVCLRREKRARAR